MRINYVIDGVYQGVSVAVNEDGFLCLELEDKRLILNNESVEKCKIIDIRDVADILMSSSLSMLLGEDFLASELIVDDNEKIYNVLIKTNDGLKFTIALTGDFFDILRNSIDNSKFKNN